MRVRYASLVPVAHTSWYKLQLAFNFPWELCVLLRTTPHPATMKISLPTTVDKVVAGDAGTSIDNPIDALIIGAGPSGEEIFQTENRKNEASRG